MIALGPSLFVKIVQSTNRNTRDPDPKTRSDTKGTYNIDLPQVATLLNSQKFLRPKKCEPEEFHVGSIQIIVVSYRPKRKYQRREPVPQLRGNAMQMFQINVFNSLSIYGDEATVREINSASLFGCIGLLCPSSRSEVSWTRLPMLGALTGVRISSDAAQHMCPAEIDCSRHGALWSQRRLMTPECQMALKRPLIKAIDGDGSNRHEARKSNGVVFTDWSTSGLSYDGCYLSTSATLSRSAGREKSNYAG